MFIREMAYRVNMVYKILQVKVHISGKKMVLYMMVTGREEKEMVSEPTVNQMVKVDLIKNTQEVGKMT